MQETSKDQAMSSIAISLPDGWDKKAKEVARNILAKIGTAVVRDGIAYVVAESVRRKIANLILTHPSKTKIGHIELNIDEWLTIPPHAIQRDTEDHAKECREKFAKTRRAHQNVAIAVHEDGTIEILDANTRTYFWRNMLVPITEIPADVQVAIHFVKDEAESAHEYYTFDDGTQVKNGNDQLFSACHANKFYPIRHGFIYRGNGIVDALRTSFATLAGYGLLPKTIVRRAMTTPNLRQKCKPTMTECVRQFKPALQALDSLNVRGGKFKGAVTRAFLLSFTKYAEIGFGDKKADLAKLMEFFTRYRDGIALRKDGKFDAVENFRAIHAEEGGGEKRRKDKTARLLGAIERYIENGPNRMYAHDGVVNMNDYFVSRTALSKGNNRRKKKGGDGGATIAAR
jgi:hypothetical protein